ncbi:MAG: ABC transporter substrate-binding protein, partial [Anaerolineae bacterium]
PARASLSPRAFRSSSCEIDYIGDPFTLLSSEALIAHANRLKSADVAQTYWIYINTEKLPMNSAKIRKALSCVLDRKALTQHLFIGQIPHKSPVCKALSLLTEKQMYQDADLATGIKLFDEGLQELGLSRETCPPLVLSHSDIANQKNFAETVQQVWQNAFGISVKIEGSDWSTFSSSLNARQFQLGGCVRRALYKDPYAQLEVFKEKDYSQNSSSWDHSTYKRLLTLATKAKDEKERKEYLEEAEKILLDEMPVIPIFANTYQYMTSDKFDKFIIDKSGYVDFKKVVFKK